MKKLIFFFESVHPEGTAVAIRASFIIREFVSAFPDFEIIVLTGTKNPTKEPGVQFISLDRPKEYKDVGFVFRAFREVRLGIFAALRICKLRRDCGFIYISSPSYLASIFVSLCSYLLRIPFIFEVRDVYPEAFQYANLLKRESFVYRVFASISRLIYRKSLLNISATEGISKLIKAQAGDSICIVSSNGFPELMLSMNNDKFERFSVVFHGALGLFQDVDLVLAIADLLESHDDIDFYIIGHGVKSKLVEGASNKNRNIKFLGGLGYEETIGVVSKCHIGLSFRYDDPLSLISFPVKNWEYFGLAIPSIVTPRGSEAGDFLERNLCGMQFLPDEKQEIANQIIRLKCDSHAYNFYVDNCVRLRERFTRENLACDLAKSVMSNFS